MVPPEERGLLGWLDGPRLVIGAFMLFLVGLTILGILLWSDQREQVDRIDEIIVARQIEAVAANKESVRRCYSAATQGPGITQVLKSLEGQTSNPVAREHFRNFRVLNELNTPTLRECRQLAETLNVPIPKGVE